MSVTFEQFFSAIAEQESGGRYGAVGANTGGGHRAYGKYQVMDFNIPAWTKAYYGKSLTPQQYLNNPRAQDAVARGVLRSYYNKYGARGAAAAWYAGPGNANNTYSTRSQYGGPSIKGYVDSVLSKAGRYPSSGGGHGSGGGGGAPEEKPMARGERAESYGFVEALLDSNPELKKLFKKAVAGDWEPGKFQASLRDTRWWKTHSEDERNYLVKKYGDPASATQDYNAAYIKVRQLANSLGLRETDGNVKRLRTWAYNMVAKGWDESQLRNEIGKYVYFNDDVWQGEGGEAQEKLRSYAYSMGVQMSGQWYADSSREIIRGLGTQQDYEDKIRRQAKSLYSNFSKQIDAGQTVADIAAPYMQSMAQILELPAGSVNLFSKDVKKALQYKDPQTGANAVKPLWQFENDLRQDPRWRQTKNAQDSMMQVAHQVLSDFGLKY